MSEPKWVSYEQLSRTEWGYTPVRPGEFPGNERLALGYLARIAKAVEQIAGDMKDVKEATRVAIDPDRREEYAKKQARMRWASEHRPAIQRLIDAIVNGLTIPAGEARSGIRHKLDYALVRASGIEWGATPAAEAAKMLAAVDAVAVLRGLKFKPGSKREKYHEKVVAELDKAKAAAASRPSAAARTPVPPSPGSPAGPGRHHGASPDPSSP